MKCGVRGDIGPGCNAVGMIDRRVLGIQHLYTHPVYLKTAVCKKNAVDEMCARRKLYYAYLNLGSSSLNLDFLKCTHQIVVFFIL